MKLKVITWNLNRAAYTKEKLWSYLHSLNFDIGLFQGVYVIPYALRKQYYSVRAEMNAILVKKNLTTKVEKENIIPDCDVLTDFYTAAQFQVNGEKIVFINVYNYIGPTEIDFSAFLNGLLSYIRSKNNQTTIIGGCFGINEEFEDKKWGEVAKKLKDELHQIGYIDVFCNRKPVSTYLSPRNGKAYQVDYIFIPKKSIKVKEVEVEDENKIFYQKPRLSNHLPIVAILEKRGCVK